MQTILICFRTSMCWKINHLLHPVTSIWGFLTHLKKKWKKNKSKRASRHTYMTYIIGLVGMGRTNWTKLTNCRNKKNKNKRYMRTNTPMHVLKFSLRAQFLHFWSGTFSMLWQFLLGLHSHPQGVCNFHHGRRGLGSFQGSYLTRIS